MDRKGSDQDFDVLLRKQLASSASSAEVSDQCPDENIVGAYLEKKLPQKLRQSFERHASRCNRCQQELGSLLKEEISHSAVSHDWEHAIQEKRFLPSVTDVFRKFQVWGLKPALALILVTIISSYIGYEVFKQRSSVSRPEADRFEARLKRGLAQEQNLPSAPQKGRAQAPSGPSPAMPSSTRSGLEAARTRLPSGSAIETNRLEPSVEIAKAPTAQQPVPGAAPAELAKVQETSELAAGETGLPVKEEGRKDSLGATFAHEKLNQERSSGTTASLPKAVESTARPPKPTVRDQEGFAPSLDAVGTLKSEEGVAGPLPSAVPSEAKHDGQAAVVVSDEKKGRVQALSVRAEQESLDTLKPTEGHRVEIAGKIFVLRRNIWTDLSITPGEFYSRVFISRTSPEFPQQVKPLAAYRKLLSRPEDVMVLYQGKVYWISSRSRPPEEP
jgi:hypothetical protein